MNDVLNLLSTAIALLFVLVTHEIAHGLVALWNGDNTAKNAGRLSPNPFRHLDLYGTIFLLVFKFGWAKPVPVNSNNFNNKRVGLFTVSIAGIVVNLLTALIAAFLFVLSINSIGESFITILLYKIVNFGIVFAIFNLIPIPPLDGSKILASFLPKSFERFIYKYERIFYILLLVLLYTRTISKIMHPAINYIYDSIFKIVLSIL